MSVPTIVVTGTRKNPAGDPSAGTIKFQLTHPLVDAVGNLLVDRQTITSTLNASGQLTDTNGSTVGLTLYCTSGGDIAPAGVLYRVTEEITGSGVRARNYLIALPSSLGATVDLADLVPLESTAGIVWGLLELDDLADVNAPSPDDGDGLVWDDTTGRWIPSAASGGGATNLGYTASPTQGVVTSDTGTDATVPAADGTNAGLLLPAEKTKLAGVATGATANDTDANLKNRANHTGTQTAATISDFATAADARVVAVVVKAFVDALGVDAATLDGETVASLTTAITAAIVDAAPGTLDTLNEVAAALGDDPNFVTTITNLIAAKAADADVVHDTGNETVAGVKTFTSAPLVPDNSWAIADTSGLQTALDAKAPTANPTFTGTVTIPDGALAIADTSGLQTALDAKLAKVAGGASVEDIGAIESNVNTVAASGSTETLDTSLYGVHDVTMDQACTFTFGSPAPSGKNTTFVLILRGAFTPTFPASVDWGDGAAPTYTTPSMYVFTTVDAGTIWLGTSAGKAFA